ncbi:hypothetical protein CBF23_008880 [Marinomonas agarivorans]|nr:hypothetical protein CBF23_008880 [Marinomonas agarivorans]
MYQIKPKKNKTRSVMQKVDQTPQTKKPLTTNNPSINPETLKKMVSYTFTEGVILEPNMEQFIAPPTSEQAAKWNSDRTKRLKLSLNGKSEGSEGSAYGVICGWSNGKNKLILAKKTLINNWTTNDGVRKPQVPIEGVGVEMRGPLTLGLPGGNVPKDSDFTNIACSELLAEAAVNVANNNFKLLDTKIQSDKGYRYSHTYFLYKGDIDELAKRMNGAIQSGYTADNEICMVKSIPLDEVSNTLKTLSTNNADTLKPVPNKSTLLRWIGSGNDWHQKISEEAAKLMLGQETEISNYNKEITADEVLAIGNK